MVSLGRMQSGNKGMADIVNAVLERRQHILGNRRRFGFLRLRAVAEPHVVLAALIHPTVISSHHASCASPLYIFLFLGRERNDIF